MPVLDNPTRPAFARIGAQGEMESAEDAETPGETGVRSAHRTASSWGAALADRATTLDLKFFEIAGQSR